MFKSVTPLNILFFILDQAVIYSFCENCRTLLICFVSFATIFLTTGAITNILGKAIGQAMLKACIQLLTKLRENPVKIVVSTPDISNAMSTDMKKANNKWECLGLIFII